MFAQWNLPNLPFRLALLVPLHLHLPLIRCYGFQQLKSPWLILNLKNQEKYDHLQFAFEQIDRKACLRLMH